MTVWINFLFGGAVIAFLTWALVALYFVRRMRRIIKNLRR